MTAIESLNMMMDGIEKTPRVILAADAASDKAREGVELDKCETAALGALATLGLLVATALIRNDIRVVEVSK